MNKMLITTSLGALLIGATIYLAGCGPASGSSPFVQINSQDVNNNSNDNNSPNGTGDGRSLAVTNESDLVRVSCDGPAMEGTWNGVCDDVYTQGVFSCPGETLINLCQKMCFIYGDIEVCI